MAVDLRDLLQRSAAAPPRPLEVEAVVARGLRRRRRRRVLQGAGVAAVLAVAVAGALALPATRTELAGRSAGSDWPLAVRYAASGTEAGGHPRDWVLEFSANGWGDWMTVSDAGDGRLIVQRYGPGRRDAFADLRPVSLLDDPFAALEAAQEAAFASDSSSEPAEGLVPGPLLSPGFARLLEMELPPEAAIAEDLPGLRAEVAERLGIDAGLLASARIEWEDCWGDICGPQRRTSVWLVGVGLPVYAEEADPDGTVYRIVATHLRAGVGPPPNPVPEPPPVAPGASEPAEPVSDAGLRWELTELSWSIDEGSIALLQVRREQREAEFPETLALERWDGERWRPVADVPVTPEAGGSDGAVRLALPADVEPGSHRLVTPGRAELAVFWHAGDPNR